jgi:hypothetical protein
VSVLIIVLFMCIMMTGYALNVEAQEIKRNSNGQYPIGSKVKIYNGDLKPINAYFTYASSYTWKNYNFDKVVVLYHSDNLLHEAFLFSRDKELGEDDSIGFFRNSIDKCIEWAATAKKNNVHSLKKEIPTPDGYRYDTFVTTAQMVGNPPSHFNVVAIMFTFYIGDFWDNGKEETLLIMAVYDFQTARAIRMFCFRENDFALLKEIFSESYLAEIDRKEEAWQKSQAEKDALFK